MQFAFLSNRIRLLYYFEGMMPTNKTKNIYVHKALLILVSTLSALIWIGLIHAPQEENKVFVLWTTIYYLPFFAFALTVCTYAFSMDTMMPVKAFFLSNISFIAITVVLLCLLVWSMMAHFEEITYISFATNLFAFLFATCFYFKMAARRG